MPATFRSPSSTSFGHLRSASPGEGSAARRARSTAAATASGPAPHRGRSSTENGQRRPVRASPTRGPAVRGRRSGARRPRPARRRRRPGHGRRRGRWCWAPRRPPRRSQRPAAVGQQVAVEGWAAAVASVTGTRLADEPHRRPAQSERRAVKARRGHRRPRGHRHPHHGGQAAGPRPPARRGGARRLGEGGGEAARQGAQDRPGADRAALRRGFVRRARRAGPAPVDGVRPGEEAPVRRRRGDRLRHHRRPPGVRVLPGLHGLRRVAGRGLRREDHQGDGPRHQDRLPDHRHQRGRRRADPGGRRLARPVRRDLPPQRARLRRHPADLDDHGLLRRRARLLPRGHRLHDHGRRHLEHVHHRPRRHQDGHR